MSRCAVRSLRSVCESGGALLRSPCILTSDVDRRLYSERRWQLVQERLQHTTVVTKVIASHADWYAPRQSFASILGSELFAALSAQTNESWPRYYLTQPLAPLPALREALPVPHEVRALKHEHDTVRGQLFLGKSGISKCHYHSFEHALLCQLHGEKELLLFPPSDTRTLQPLPWHHVEHAWSTLNFDSVDTFTRLKDTRPQQVLLSPGDALFIPAGWWHVVWGRELSASVTYFWGNPRAPWRYAALREQGLRNAFDWFVRRPLRQWQLSHDHDLPSWITRDSKLE